MQITEFSKFAKKGHPDTYPYQYLDDYGSRFIRAIQEAGKKHRLAETRTLLFYLGKGNKILAAQHIADIDFEALDVDAIAEKANAHGSKNLYIAHNGVKPPFDISRERVLMDVIGPLPGMDAEVRQLLQLTKQLEQKDISVVEIDLHDYETHMLFSQNVSAEKFWGLQSNADALFDSGNQKLKAEKQYQKVFKEITEDAAAQRQGLPAFPIAYAFALDKFNYYQAYRVPVSNLMQVPGFAEGQRLLPEKIFDQIVRNKSVGLNDDSLSMTFILHKNADELAVDEKVSAFAEEAKTIAGKYGIPVKEIILLGSYDPASGKYQSLKI